MLLMANSSRDDEPALLELRKFALRRSRACARFPNQLRGIAAPLRPAEKHTPGATHLVDVATLTGAVRTRCCVFVNSASARLLRRDRLETAFAPNMGRIIPELGMRSRQQRAKAR